MAESDSRGFMDLLECPVCNEDFTESGDHIPRLLPCSHTFCESCIKQLLQQGGGNRLTCPNCNKKHQAEHGMRSFPQNKYTLAMIGHLRTPAHAVFKVNTKCKQHGKKLTLYCKDPGCQLPICTSCAKKDHLAHDWVQIEEEGNEILRDAISQLEENLASKLEKLTRSKDVITSKYERCLNEVKAKKEAVRHTLDEALQKFDSLIEEVLELIYRNETDDEIGAIIKHMDLMKRLKEQIDSRENAQGFDESLEMVLTARKRAEKDHSGTRIHTYPVYEPGEPVCVEKMCGKISLRDAGIDLVVPVSGPITDASELHCTVTRSINTGFSSFLNCYLGLTSSTILVSGKENKQHKIKIYDVNSVRSGRDVSSVTLDYEPFGMTQMTLRGQAVVALADRDRKRIEFRDADDMNRVIHTHSVAPHQPTRLCSVSTSSLLYDDLSSRPRQIYWLDCSVIPCDHRRVINTQQYSINDMCCVTNGNEQLLVTVSAGNIQVCNTRTDELLWQRTDKLSGMKKRMDACGVTTDGRGHMLVCDTSGNNGVFMFRVLDGEYLGCLMKESELGHPFRIRWCENLSSLILVHLKEGDNYHVSFISVK